MNLRPCMVHVGMYKTGTTSIQTTLYWRLRDRRFRLLTRDAAWGNLAIGSMFLANAAELPAFQTVGLAGSRLAAFKRSSTQALSAALDRARRSEVTPILSAEIAWLLNEHEVQGMDRFLRDQGFQARVLACVRAPQDYITSAFQEIVKTGVGDWAEMTGRIRSLLDYREKLAAFDRVFGREQVDAYAFDPASFAGRCAVQEFCRRIGAELPPHRVIRVNETMNGSVLRFLYTYNQHAGSRGLGRSGAMRRFSLLHRLRTLPGPGFRISPEVVPGIRERYQEQQGWLEERLGRALPWSISDAAASGISAASIAPAEKLTIRNESDLFAFDAPSRTWLARRTGRATLPVAEQLQHLNR